jgi:hypothetical protein
MVKKWCYKSTLKIVKIDLKIDAKKPFYNARHGGVPKCQKSSNFDVGDPGPPIYKLFEISALFAKTVQISTPKIDPKRGPIENPIPHKNACTFAPMGVRKCHFWGGRGADRSDRKM